MPKKKANGYMLFVSELKSKGIIDRARLPSQATTDASSLWDALSKQEQEVYKQRAKRMSGQVTDLPLISRGFNFDGPKYQGCGLSVKTGPSIKTFAQYPVAGTDEYYKMEINNEIFGFRMEKDNKYILRDKKFLFGHFLNYVETDDDETVPYPAEFAFIEFSIEEGIGKTFNKAIYPGDLPLGFGVDLKNNEEVKGLVPHELAKSKGLSTNFVEICNRLQEMMDDCSDSRNVIFTGQDDMKQMEGCIRFIFEKAKGEGRSRLREDLKMTSCEVKVLPVEILVQILIHEFSYLSKASLMMEVKGQEKKHQMYLLPSSEKEKLLSHTTMSYERFLGCPTHASDKYSVGMPHCSLGNVKRWILKILQLVNYPLIQHLYKISHEKDPNHFFDRHIYQVQMARSAQLEELKKRAMKIRGQGENEKLKKILEENQRKVAEDSGLPSYILADNPGHGHGDEEGSNFVMGRGRGGGRDSRISRYPYIGILPDNNNDDEGTYPAMAMGRGRGRGNGNKFFRTS